MTSPTSQLLALQSPHNSRNTAPPPFGRYQPYSSVESVEEEHEEANLHRVNSLQKALIEHSDAFVPNEICTFEGVIYLDKVYESIFKKILSYEDHQRKESDKAMYFLAFVSTFVDSKLYPQTDFDIRTGHNYKTLSGPLSLATAKRQLAAELSKTTKDREGKRLRQYNDKYGAFDPNHLNGGTYEDPEGYIPMQRSGGYFKLTPYDVAVAINQDDLLKATVGDMVPPNQFLTINSLQKGDLSFEYYEGMITSSLSDLTLPDRPTINLITNVCNHMGQLLMIMRNDRRQAMVDLLPIHKTEGTLQSQIQHATLGLIVAHLLERDEEDDIHVFGFPDAVDAIQSNMYFSELKDYAYAYSWE